MRGTFYGWYFKCQSQEQTLAIIPALHGTGRERTCSVQLVTQDKAWVMEFPGALFHKEKKRILLGDNAFDEMGITLAIDAPGLRVEGKLDFGPITPLRYDIMGPFAWVPFLECRHSVYSMYHTVNGRVCINERVYSFSKGDGYWEGDRGRSFPRKYAWTQCCFPEGSLMLSVADVPVAGFHFTGVIGIIWWKGREYRLATYLGAKAVFIHHQVLRIAQGDLTFEARLLEAVGCPLRAPKLGSMERTIHESAANRAAYQLKKGKKILIDFQTDKASFEYEYPQ